MFGVIRIMQQFRSEVRMRIVGISGLWRGRPWQTLAPAFLAQFPEARFYIEDDPGCWPTEVDRMRRFIDVLLERYDDGEEMLVVGHSMGGVYACAMAARLTHTPILGIATIFSPHAFPYAMFPRLLGADVPLKAPVVSFGAARDEVVWWGTRHQQSLIHVDLPCDHCLELSCDRALADRIASIAKEHFLV